MLLKTHPLTSTNVKFDEYKFLKTQYDRLAEDMDKIDTRPSGRKNLQNKYYKPYIHRGRARHHRNYPSYDRAYVNGHMLEREEVILHLEVDPDVATIQEGHTEYKRTMQVEVRVDNKVNADHQLQDLELHQWFLMETKIYVLIVDNLVVLPKNVLRRTHLVWRHIVRCDHLTLDH